MYSLLEKHALIMQGEPQNYQDAISCKDAVHWKAAMEEEMKSLQTNQTWDVVSCPEDKKVIDSKWVYKLKSLGGNQIHRYKARLVVRGFTQEYGTDYVETFSPVAKYTSIRAILAISASEHLNLTQFDVKTAFLNGDLKEELYMRQPQGFDDGSGRVCRLRKSLYGLKQASRCWNQRFTKVLKELSLKPSIMDPCVFISDNDGSRVVLAIYIDDGLIAARKKEDAVKLIGLLKQQFDITILGGEFFLGMEIRRRPDGSIHVSQEMYAERVLKKFNMDNCKPASTPAEKYASGDSGSLEGVKFPYREAVGSLMYLAIATRPDISFAVGVVSRYLDAPTQAHVNAVKRILKYISGTRKMGIFFGNHINFTLVCFSDADYAGDTATRRSTTGFVFMIGNGPVSWSSQRQKCVSLSTTESEYVAASQAVKEMVWLQNLFAELVPSGIGVTTLNMDNQGAIRLVKNPEFHKRTKHIDVRYHFIRERYDRGDFNIQYVSSEHHRADILMKLLAKDKFEKFRSLIGVVNFM